MRAADQALGVYDKAAGYSLGVVWEFEAKSAEAAAWARREFVRALRSKGAVADPFAAEVVFSELVGNAVRHAPGRVQVQLEFDGGDAVLRVRDSGPGFEPATTLPTNPLAEGGRGLYIVSQLAKEFKAERTSRDGMTLCAVLP